MDRVIVWRISGGSGSAVRRQRDGCLGQVAQVADLRINLLHCAWRGPRRTCFCLFLAFDRERLLSDGEQTSNGDFLPCLYRQVLGYLTVPPP